MKKIISNWLVILLGLLVLILAGVVAYSILKGESRSIELVETETLVTTDMNKGDEPEEGRRVEKIRYVKDLAYNVATAEALNQIVNEDEKLEIVEVVERDGNFAKLQDHVKNDFSVAATDCLVLDEVELVFNDGSTLGIQLDEVPDSSCEGYYVDELGGRGVILSVGLVDEVRKLVMR